MRTHVDLSSNHVGVRGGAALGAALAQLESKAGALHTLLLHGNPLGWQGVVHVLQGVAVLTDNGGGRHLSCIGLDNTDAKGLQPEVCSVQHPDTYDPQRPTGLHALDLAHPAHRRVAESLVTLACAGTVRWTSAKLNEQPLPSAELPAAAWKHVIPDQGLLQARMRANIW